MELMKKVKGEKPEDEMRKEYDFTGGVRGKYAKRCAEGTNIVVLDGDVSEYFPDSESVNRALRMIVEIADKQKKRARRRPSSQPSTRQQ